MKTPLDKMKQAMKIEQTGINKKWSYNLCLRNLQRKFIAAFENSETRLPAETGIQNLPEIMTPMAPATLMMWCK